MLAWINLSMKAEPSWPRHHPKTPLIHIAALEKQASNLYDFRDSLKWYHGYFTITSWQQGLCIGARMRAEGSIDISNHKVNKLINPSHSLKLEASSGEHLGHYHMPSTDIPFNIYTSWLLMTHITNQWSSLNWLRAWPQTCSHLRTWRM